MESEYNCLICLEPITNPVCVNCFVKQINMWLREQEISKFARRIIMSNIIKKIPFTSWTKEKCILCGKEEISVCAYCFFLKSLETLYELNAPPDVIDSFNIVFNYSLWHEEYA